MFLDKGKEECIKEIGKRIKQFLGHKTRQKNCVYMWISMNLLSTWANKGNN